MVFSEKWLRNHPQFLLDFLIHIDVLMLCRKSESMVMTLIFMFICTCNEVIYQCSWPLASLPCTVTIIHYSIHTLCMFTMLCAWQTLPWQPCEVIVM